VTLAVLSNGSILNGECHSDKNKDVTSFHQCSRCCVFAIGPHGFEE